MTRKQLRSAIAALNEEMDDIHSVDSLYVLAMSNLIYDNLFNIEMGDEIDWPYITLNSLELNRILIKYLQFICQGGKYE